MSDPSQRRLCLSLFGGRTDLQAEKALTTDVWAILRIGQSIQGRLVEILVEAFSVS